MRAGLGLVMEVSCPEQPTILIGNNNENRVNAQSKKSPAGTGHMTYIKAPVGSQTHPADAQGSLRCGARTMGWTSIGRRSSIPEHPLYLVSASRGAPVVSLARTKRPRREDGAKVKSGKLRMSR